MKNETNKPAHITKGDVLDDLGLSRSEASALKVKATLLDAILHEVESRGYTQNQLVEILDEYQPSVSNLVRGKIAKVSLEKLLAYSDRLRMKTSLTVRGSSNVRGDFRVRSGSHIRSRARYRSDSRSARRTAATVR